MTLSSPCQRCRAVAVALLVVLPTGCGAPRPEHARTTEIDDFGSSAIPDRAPHAAEAAAMGDIVYWFFAKEEPPRDDLTFIFCADTTAMWGPSADFTLTPRAFHRLIEDRGLSRETVAAYLANNRRSWRLPDQFQPPLRCEVAEEKTTRALLRGDSPQEAGAFARGRTMVVELSRAGLDQSGSQALLYLFWQREPLWGGGHLVFAKKIAGKWKIVAEEVLVQT